MAYRESVDAANARIEALEHEVAALHASARELDVRQTTPRERELTLELERAHREIEALRHGAPTAATRRPRFDPVLFAVLVVVSGVFIAFAAGVTARSRPARLAARSAPSTGTPAPVAAPPSVPDVAPPDALAVSACGP